MRLPRVIHSVDELRSWRAEAGGRSVGFVPTMGALHDGHASLMKRARAENEVSVLSIFVNPTQFNRKDDLEKYPRTWEQDLKLAAECGVDVVFAPRDPAELYPDGYRYQVGEKEFSRGLCGAHRPGHFDGVLTVVLKLLNLVGATRAYFGEKDFQQLKLIQEMVSAFFLPVEIVPCPTLREADGLAMSSRNLRLSPQERELAPRLYETMVGIADLDLARERLTALGFKVDYLEDIDGRRFAAAWLGDVRLIDNLPVGKQGT